MIKRLLLIVNTILLFASCSTKTTVAVARHPLIQFQYDSLSWQDNSYFITGPSKIVAYPADTTVPGKLYSRYILVAYGKDAKGNNLQFTINFDAADPNQLIGTYKPAYSSNGGLALVQLFNLDNNNLSEYSLYTTDSTSYLQIQRQSSEEMLVAGVFQMTLFNARDTSQKIFITNGSLADISY